MIEEPSETAELLAFVRVIEAGSVSRAAVELGVPRATLGHRLERLEERLGVRLVHRNTRRVVLTDAGEAFYPRARGVLAALRDAEAAVRQADGAVRGLLRVSLPPDGRGVFNPVLLAFHDRYPDVRLEAHFTTAHVDLVGTNYDVAIRAAQELDPSLVARRLATADNIAVASPGYLARGVPRTAEDLARHTCLVGFARGEVPATHWPLLAGGQVRVEGGLVSNSIELLAAAAMAGRGIALLPRPLIADALADGRLVPVLEGIVGAKAVIAAVYPARQLVPPAVRAFVDFVAAWPLMP